MPENLDLEPQKPPQVELDTAVESSAPPVPDAEVTAILEENGLIYARFSGATLAPLAKMGLHADQTGFMQVQKGGVIISQAQLRKVLEKLTARIDEDSENMPIEDLKDIARAAGYVAKVLADSTKTAVQHFSAKDRTPTTLPANRTKCLPPGVNLQINVQPGGNVQIADKKVDSKPAP